MLIDPIWSTLPVEAVSQTFSVLIFSPLGYIGEKCGDFLKGVLSGIPILLKPFVLVLVILLIFISISKFRIWTPFLSIEPSWGLPLPSPVRNEIMERPDGPVVRANSRDQTTDTDDLEDYILSSQTSDQRRSGSATFSSFQTYFSKMIDFLKQATSQFFSSSLWNHMKTVFSIALTWLDRLLRGTIAEGNVVSPESPRSQMRREYGLEVYDHRHNETRSANSSVSNSSSNDSTNEPSSSSRSRRKRKSVEHKRSKSASESVPKPSSSNEMDERRNLDTFMYNENEPDFNFGAQNDGDNKGNDRVWRFGRGGSDADEMVSPKRPTVGTSFISSQRAVNRRHSSGVERISRPLPSSINVNFMHDPTEPNWSKR